MSKTSRHSPTCLEVTVMFEPHRLQNDLLQRAYALLIPLPRRRRAGAPSPSGSPHVQPPEARRKGSVMTTVQVAWYAQVSSEQQAEANTIASQLAELRTRIAMKGFDLSSLL